MKSFQTPNCYFVSVKPSTIIIDITQNLTWNEDELTVSSEFTQHFTSEWVLTQLNKTTRQQFSVPLIKFFVCSGGRRRETSGWGNGLGARHCTKCFNLDGTIDNTSLSIDQIIDYYGTLTLHYSCVWVKLLWILYFKIFKILFFIF